VGLHCLDRSADLVETVRVALWLDPLPADAILVPRPFAGVVHFIADNPDVTAVQGIVRANRVLHPATAGGGKLFIEGRSGDGAPATKAMVQPGDDAEASL